MSRTHASPVLPDLRGRTALVTGASNGVGVEIARGLAAAGAALVLAREGQTRFRELRTLAASVAGGNAVVVGSVSIRA